MKFHSKKHDKKEKEEKYVALEPEKNEIIQQTEN